MKTKHIERSSGTILSLSYEPKTIEFEIDSANGRIALGYIEVEKLSHDIEMWLDLRYHEQESV